MYDPSTFTDDHAGRTKEQLLDEERRGFDVLLVEGMANPPRAGQGQPLGGRPQIECGRSPAEYLRDLPGDEVGLTPEAYIVAFLDALQHRGQVLDTQAATYLLGAYFNASRNVPSAYWNPEHGSAHLGRDDPGDRYTIVGARPAVRVD